MPETWNSTISVVSYKSRIRATVSSNLSSSSSNLMLFGTAIRLSKQINLRRDCIEFEKRKTYVKKKTSGSECAPERSQRSRKKPDFSSRGQKREVEADLERDNHIVV